MAYSLSNKLSTLYEAIFNKLRYFNINEPTELEIADAFKPFISYDTIIATKEIVVGKYANEDLITGVKYNSIKTAIDEAEAGSHITVEEGIYTENNNITIAVDLSITFRQGAVLRSDTRKWIGWDANPMDRHISINGSGDFVNFGFKFGDASSLTETTDTTVFLEFQDITVDGIQAFYWSNLKTFKVKYRDLVSTNGLNTWDSDGWGGDAEFDFVSAKVEGTMADLNNRDYINLTFKNGYISHKKGINGYCTFYFYVMNGSKIEYNNIKYISDEPIEIQDNADETQSDLAEAKLINSAFEFSCDNVFLLTADHDTPLISENSFVNKSEGVNNIAVQNSLPINLSEAFADVAVTLLDTLDSFNVSDIDFGANKISNINIGLTKYAKVRLTTTGALPGGLSTDTDYYVIPVTSTSIKLASSYANAEGGTAVDINSTGSGTHTIKSATLTMSTVYNFPYAKVQIATTGTLPSGLSLLTDYYIIPSVNGKIRLASSYANALEGIGVDITTVGIGTHTINTAIFTHNNGNLFNLARVQVETTGVLPTGLSAATDYFVVKLSSYKIKLASSYANALAGITIDVTTAGTGSHTLNAMGGLFSPVTGALTVLPDLKVYQFGVKFS